MRARHARSLAGLLLLATLLVSAPAFAERAGHREKAKHGQDEQGHDQGTTFVPILQLFRPAARGASATALPATSPAPLPAAPAARPHPASAGPVPGPDDGPFAGSVGSATTPDASLPAQDEGPPDVAAGFGNVVLAAGKHLLVVGGVALLAVLGLSIGGRRRA